MPALMMGFCIRTAYPVSVLVLLCLEHRTVPSEDCAVLVGAVRQLGRLPELFFHYKDNFNSLCHGANEAD